MAKLKFSFAKLAGITTVVPSKRILLDDEAHFYATSEKIKRLKEVVGLKARAVVNPGTTPSDLMYQAARHLIENMSVELTSIDAIICVLDNPDYKCPPTACVLHGRLNLPKHCMAFDINHGCAGYVYGLTAAYSLIDSGLQKVLLLVGDTKSTTINIKDRVSAPLFGDGASASLIIRTDLLNPSFFVLGTVGSKYENIIIPAGGARLPTSDRTMLDESDKYGNVRSLNNFRMNGREVFDFTISEVPKNIKELFEFSNYGIEDIDYFIFHQANKSIIENIAKRIGISDLSRVPSQTLGKIGNLAVASIPSVINDQLTNKIVNTLSKNLMLAGFGVGLSYGSCIITVDEIYCPPLIEYQGE